MNKDYFEQMIGEKLRQGRAEVPAGAWNLIQSKIQTTAGPGSSGHFGFGAAIVVGGLLLAGLAVHSTIGGDVASIDAPIAGQVETVAQPDGIKSMATTQSADPHEPTASIELIERPAQALKAEATDLGENTSLKDPIVTPIKVQSTKAQTPENAAESLAQFASYEPEADMSATQRKTPVKAEEEEIETGGAPDDVLQEELAPFSAEIYTSGSFGYAPFTVEFENRGTATGQVWDFGTYGKSTEQSPTVVFEKPGLYSVMLSAFRGENEQKIEFITIEVEEGSSLYVPNSFTPDGDGQNEVFQAKGSKLETFGLTVVNSKGAIVFQTLDIEEPWHFDHALHGGDGEFYFVVVRARGIDGKTYNIRHQINIIY